jgi:hypothetical protein
MKIKRITEADFNTISQWWLDWGQPIPDPDYLPSDGTGGYIATKNGVPVAAGYLYFTNARIAYIDFVISNKEYREKDRNTIITELIDYMVNHALSIGCKFVWATSQEEGIISKVKKLKYSVLKDKHSIIYKYA